MTAYPPDSPVAVHPFTHSREGDSVTIGDEDRQVFLAIPASGLDLLQWLADGATVDQAARRYQERYGEPVDIDAFLRALSEEGFVGSNGATPDGAAAGGAAAAAGNGHRPARRWSGHLDWISPAMARRLLGAPVLVGCGLLVAAALVLIAIDPGLVPGTSALLYPQDLALLTWATFLLAIAGTMVHEVAHVVAARAAGARARIGISHRLYVPVLETDMTGIWMAPRRQRLLAFLAGPIVDAAAASVLLGVVFAVRQGWLSLPQNGWLLLQGVTFTYLARLLWQTFLFLRTDFYYTLAAALKCKNLMNDTENFLENLIARLRRARPRVDQSRIPRSEMRAVRLFAILWLWGRFVSIAALITITVPILWFYLQVIVDYLTNPVSSYGGLDFLTTVLLSGVVTMLGIVLWFRSLYRGWRRRRAAKRRLEAAVAA